jgi:hypothetical protein
MYKNTNRLFILTKMRLFAAVKKSEKLVKRNPRYRIRENM